MNVSYVIYLPDFKKTTKLIFDSLVQQENKHFTTRLMND